MSRYAVTILGDDRPGIIAGITDILFRADCNIENVSQMILQSEFVGVFIVAAPAGRTVDGLTTELVDGLADPTLRVFVKPVEIKAGYADRVACDSYVITTFGPDAKGLVARMTAVMARHRVNVTNLKAVFEGGDDPNKNYMIYEADVPVASDFAVLSGDLRKTAESLGLDIFIQHRDIFRAVHRIY